MSTPNLDSRYITPAGVDTKIAAQATTDAGQYDRSVLPTYAPSGLTKKFDPKLGVYNFNPTNTRNWSKAFSMARSGLGLARLNFYGDSITMGGTLSSSSTQAFQNHFKKMLGTLAGATVYEGQTPICGYNLTGTTDAGDTRFVWPNDAINVSGGLFNKCVRIQVGGGTITFTPNDQCDSFAVYYATDPGAATAKIWIDSNTGAAVNLTGNAAQSIQKATVTGTLGTHTLSIGNITGTAGTSIAILGVEPITGTAGIRVSRMGLGGMRWQDFNNTTYPYSSTYLAQYFAPNLSVLTLGANDYLQQTALATVQSNAQTAITAMKSVGDVVLMVSPPLSNSLTIPWSSYVAILYSLAESNNVPLIDLTWRWGSYSTMSSFYYDNVHPLVQGHWDLATAFFNVIREV